MGLFIDIETYSSVDLKAHGVYKYAAAPDFRVLLVAYSYDGEPAKVYEPEAVPPHVWQDLLDPRVRKVAHNAAFERVALAAHLGLAHPLNPLGWEDTAAMAVRQGLPAGLGDACKALGLPSKMSAGTLLINYFCKPYIKKSCAPIRRTKEHDSAKWALFAEYCRTDVDAMVGLCKALGAGVPVPAWERRVWELDQIINDRGFALNLPLARAGVQIQKQIEQRTAARLADYGISGAKAVAQIREALSARGVELPDLAAETVAGALKDETIGQEAREILQLRKAGAKSSAAKYEAALAYACEDGRARGQFKYYGAHTGRFSGKGIQPHNFPRVKPSDVYAAMAIAEQGDIELLEMAYGDAAEALAALARPLIKAADGMVLSVADYSAIEARVLAWLAGEQWKLEVFKGDGKIYEATAARMFGIPVAEVTKDLRQRGKIAELALGYQGGVGALIQFGADAFMTEPEMLATVEAYRRANPATKKFWYALEAAAAQAIRERTVVVVGRIKFTYHNGCLVAILPSKRCIVYRGAKLAGGRVTYVTHKGSSAMTKSLYGGLLAENITQAVARDLLVEAMTRMHDGGLNIVMHIHDEIVCEHTEPVLDAMLAAMSVAPAWAAGLPLNAAGYVSTHYKKD